MRCFIYSRVQSTGHILTFALSLDPELSKSPSSFSGKKIAEALVIFGEPIWQGFWRNTEDDLSRILSSDTHIPFIAENLFDFHRIFGLYGIRTSDVIAAFTDEVVSHIEVTKDRIVISRERGNPVVIRYSGEMKRTHKWILQRMRIPDIKAIEKLRQTSDRLQSHNKRVERGAFYTEELLSIKMSLKALELVHPDFIIEPYAGAGSLLAAVVNDVPNGWVNDYDKDAAAMLSADYGSLGYKVTCEDMIFYPVQKAVKIIGDAERPLFITNPPFSYIRGFTYGTEKLEKLNKKYGKRNQIQLAIGKIMEIIENLDRGYLAFFSQMGVFCEKEQYVLFLNQLLNNFTFIDGYIWSGKHFNDVREEIPVSFTIWKYGGSTDLEKIKFDCEDFGLIGFKRYPLLRDGWRYRTQKIMKGEIAVQAQGDFDTRSPKIFHNQVIKGGSEVIPENVKKPLHLKGISDELAYALWITVVGQKSLGRSSKEGYPFYDGAAYVHLPNFTLDKTKEILAYGLLYAFIGPDYTQGKIGFIGPRKVMRFGKSTRLNNGAKYLFDTYGYLPVGEQTISEILDEIKDGHKGQHWRIDIVKEISNRLEAIGYWDNIPLPLKHNNSTLF